MILIIDNYDSFTQNLAQYVGEINSNILVARNDEISIKEIEDINPTHIILSPGPGKPDESKVCLDIVRQYADKIPILGICLGHQVIGYVYGGRITKLNQPKHGKMSSILHNQKDIFHNLKPSFNAVRYHSLIIDKKNLPYDVEITASTLDGIIMGCKHKSYRKLRGIQFHPESLWTEEGKSIIANFLSS